MRLQPFTRQRPLTVTPSTATAARRPTNSLSPPWEGPSLFPPALPPVPISLTLATVVTPEKLKWHFDDARRRKGDAPGTDGVRLSQVSEAEGWDISREIVDAIHRGVWQPQAPREFRREKRDGTFRTIEIRDAFTRVVSATVAEPLSKIVKRVVPRNVGSVHGGVHQVLLLIQCAFAELGYCAIAADDVKTAFDCVSVADSLHDFAQHITDPRLLDLIEKILVGHRSPQSSLIGLAQGDPLSSPATELRLHTVLDLPEPVGRRVVPLPSRYLDNLFEIGSSVSSVTEALAEDDRRLTQAGLTLKHTDGPPRDLRESPVDLLGFRVVAAQDQVKFQLQPNAYDCLRENLEEAHQRPNPRDSARNKIHGWISSYGPVWGNADKSQVMSHIRRIASQTGFTGILSNQEVRGLLERAAQRWAQKSQGVSLAKLLGTHWE